MIRENACSRCVLSGSEYGVKNVCLMPDEQPQMNLMIVFDKPHVEDDRRGTIARNGYDAGVLMKFLRQVAEIDPNTIYITYLTKCGVKDLTPGPEEVEACFTYLQQEIEQVQPKVVLLMGESVAQVLLSAKMKAAQGEFKAVRGKMFRKALGEHEFEMIATYAPGLLQTRPSALKAFSEDFEKAWMRSEGKQERARSTNWSVAMTMGEVERVIAGIELTQWCAFDFEAHNTSINPDFNRVTGLALSFQPGMCVFVPLWHYESPFNEAQCREIVEAVGTRIMQNEKIVKIAHNIKFDMHMAVLCGMALPKGRIQDTMLQHHLISEEPGTQGLKYLAAEYFPSYGEYDQIVQKYIKSDKRFGEDWSKIPLMALGEYSCIDGDVTGRLSITFEAELLTDPKSYRIYRNEVIPGLWTLFYAEQHGMMIDRGHLADAIAEAEIMAQKWEAKLDAFARTQNFVSEMNKYLIGEKLKILEPKLKALQEKRNAGKKPDNVTITEAKMKSTVDALKTGQVVLYDKVNYGSPTQMAKLFYTEEGFGFEPPYDKKTGLYKMSTGKEVMVDIEDDSGFIDTLKIWRSITKIIATYLQGIYDRMDASGYIHTSFKQLTETGRLSSADPNLQNLPNISRLKEPDAIKCVEMVKKAFIVPKGYTLLGADFSQMELRAIAEFANEPTMLKAYADNMDLHSMLAAKIIRKALDEFYNLDPKEQKEFRTRAKAGNFGFIYGMSADSFTEYAKTNYGVFLTAAESKAVRDVFFELYPKILEYHEIYRGKARKFGYVRTLFGRRRHTPDIHSSNSFKRSMDERVAINSPIQGTGGELTIFAACLLQHRLHPRVLFVLNVHDAMYFYVPNDLLLQTYPIIKETCENLPTMLYFGKELKHVKMKVDLEASNESWKAMKPLEEYLEQNFVS